MNCPSPEKNQRILVIDDNRAIHEDFRKILNGTTVDDAALTQAEAVLFEEQIPQRRSARFQVDSAYQGEEGVARVQLAVQAQQPYAMAFVDVRMPPGMDGVETTRKLWEVDPDLQVVICTAYSDYSWDEMMSKIGYSDRLLILKKPFEAVEALQLIHALTEKWRLMQETKRSLNALEDQVRDRTRELTAEVAERRRVEQQLQIQARAMEAAANAIVIADRDGAIVWANPAFTTLTGYTAAEAIGQNPRFLKSGKQDGEFYRKLWETISSGQVWSGELINRRKDGSHYVENMTITPVRAEDGEIVRYVAIKEDTTERKRAAEELRKAEERFRIAAETSNDAVYEWDLKQSVQWFGKIDEMLGYDPDEFPRTLDGWVASVHPEDRERVMAAVQAHLEGHAAFAAEYRVRRKDGVYRWWAARGAAVRTPDGKPFRWIGTVTDITERKQVEEQLRESENKFERIFENANDGMILADAETRKFSSGNKKMQQMLGYSVEELANLGIEDIHPTESLPYVMEQFEKQFRQEIELAENLPVKRKDGSILYADVNAFPIQIEGKNYLVGVFRDITARKRLEAQVFQSQKLETVGKLAGGIAHEFNSILTAIIGQSEFLLGDLPAGSPLAKNATEISKAAGRAATLTRQLLAYGRKQFLQPEALDLNQVIASMEGMFHHLMGVDVETQIVPAAGLKAVKADAGQIEQVIMNMAINARDAMPNGGKLTLETANVSFDQESVAHYPELKPGDYVMLAITDTGTGMSAEVKARLFEPFFTTKGVGQGTGLGLSTCYGIIKQSGGHISVYSEPARGATFKIFLPQVEQQTKIPIQRLNSPDLPSGTETILLVEDDPALREMAATLLRRLGYTVLAAADGLEALSLTHQKSTGYIDLLFTDVVMPQMSGKELSDRIHALHPNTRILFTSAYTESAIVHQGVLNEGVALLQKPYTPSALAREVRAVLDGKNSSGNESHPLRSEASDTPVCV